MNNSETKKIYPDTNILVSYALGDKDENFEVAESLFNDVVKGKYKMMISNFTLMETLHTLRAIVTQIKYQELNHNLSQEDMIEIANSKDFNDEVNNESMKAFQIIIDKITRDPQHFCFEPDGLAYPGDIFLTGLQILLTTQGIIRVYRFRCRKCNSYMSCSKCDTNSEMVYKEANAPDLTHLSISEVLDCKLFFTMDKYFANIPKKDRQVEIKVLAK